MPPAISLNFSSKESGWRGMGRGRRWAATSLQNSDGRKDLELVRGHLGGLRHHELDRVGHMVRRKHLATVERQVYGIPEARVHGSRAHRSYTDPLRPHLGRENARSEERRVGKECRSRWWAS